MAKIKAAIIGASGYTGAELLRLLARHPEVEITTLYANQQAGKSMAEVYPQLATLNLPVLESFDVTKLPQVDVVFCALPHGMTQEVVAALPESVRIIDLSADFRLRNTDSYADWYGKPHAAPALQKTAVYGLSEVYGPDIATARLVACPGCYPTSVLLPLIPLLKTGMIDPARIIIDAKSGASGAGRSAKQELLFCEVNEGIAAYGLTGHRHMPEIEQELGVAANEAVLVSFIPHLVPMNRGILSTIHVELRSGFSPDSIRGEWQRKYRKLPFVHVLEKNAAPATHQVRGSNHCFINVFAGRRTGEAVIVSAIDNLGKGASGQAVQNLNLMFGFEETLGLDRVALFP